MDLFLSSVGRFPCTHKQCCIKGTPWGLEYTFSSALLVATRPYHILVFDAYMPRYICDCLRCSLIAFSASWSRSMCKFQQFPFEITRSRGVPLKSAEGKQFLSHKIMGLARTVQPGVIVLYGNFIREQVFYGCGSHCER